MSQQFWKPGSEKPRILEDEEGGVVFFGPPLSSASSSSSRFGYASIGSQRQRLPVYKYRTAILYLVETHATTIIVGETGSGKTTQIPQFLKEAGWADGGRVIACTQPRRLAVQTVASRVAEEMDVKLGEEVGYTIRFEDVTNPAATMIKFLTDGVLLREIMNDPLLTKYSVIMVDEAHERSISTDILLGLLKKIQRRRPELRLIISSATIEAKSMSDFFQTSKLAKSIENRKIMSLFQRRFLQFYLLRAEGLMYTYITLWSLSQTMFRLLFQLCCQFTSRNLQVTFLYFSLVKMILMLLSGCLLKKLMPAERSLQD